VTQETAFSCVLSAPVWFGVVAVVQVVPFHASAWVADPAYPTAEHDVMLVVRRTHRSRFGTSIVDAVSDRVAGLDAGADDYLIKPFDLDELAARIRALLRRKAGRSAPGIEHLGVVLDPAAHRVTRDGEEIALSPREFALLQLLLERPGVILSRAQIEERLYGWGEEVESNAVEVHIHGLRRKLGAQFILTVRGVGYRVRPAP